MQQCDRSRVRRLLLTTSSVLALIAGVNAGAQAACTAVVVPASNAASIDCIVISGTGDYANSGSISNAFSGGTSTAAIQVVTTLSGAIQNTGTIHADIPGTTGIRNAIKITGIVTGGITSSGTIAASGATAAGIFIFGPTSFGGGITNSGLISVSGGSSARGISLDHIATFSGGIA